MTDYKEILSAYGEAFVTLLKQAVQPYSATGKTADSIQFVASEDRLVILGRPYFKALETGRGPRKSTEQGDFLDNMLDFMRAKGIGSELSDKKKRQLARFLTLKINREGDKLFKKGGREVYSQLLPKFTEELQKALTEQFKKDLLEKLAA